MANTSWLKQTPDQPLYPNLLWSRPENKANAGKLLIVGGNIHSFSSVSSAYGAAEQAGIGAGRILLPDALQKSLGKFFAEAEFGSSTPSGSFARVALAELLESASWADGVLLAGDFGKNSETAILLESFVNKYNGLLALSGDGLDYFTNKPRVLTNRPQTLLVAELSQLQKLTAGQALIKHVMDLHRLVEVLNNWTAKIEAAVITNHADQIVVSVKGQTSSIPAAQVDFTKLAAYATVWWLQNPTKIFEALTTAALENQK